MYVGKYSKKKRGGNSPNNIIDEKINGGKSALFFLTILAYTNS